MNNKRENKIYINSELRLRFMVLDVLFVFVIVLRDCFSVGVSFGVFSGFSLVCGLLFNRKERFLLICTLLPFCRGLPFSEILLMILVIDILSNIQQMKISARLYLPIAIIALIDMLDTLIIGVNSNELIYLIVYMVYFAYIVDQEIYYGIEDVASTFFSIATLFAIIIVSIREINTMGMNYIMTYGVRIGANVEGMQVTNFNSNELGLYCVIAIALLLNKYMKNQKRIDLILAATLTMSGLVSISRTFIIVAVIAWLIFFCVQRKNRIKTLIISTIITTIVVFAIFMLFPDLSNWIVEYYIKRRQTESNDMMGGRTDILITNFEQMFTSFRGVIFGYSELYTATGIFKACHNGIEEIFVSWGIVGVGVIFYWFTALYRRCTFSIKKVLAFHLPVLCFVIYIQTLQLFTMHNYLILLLLTFIAMSQGSTEGYE